MCNFFSFVGDGFGNYKYFDWEYRKDHIDGNCDSHTAILTENKVPPDMQDRWSKYEYNPLTKLFTVDEPVEGHDHESAEAWVNALDFKQIIPQLIIKPIVNPLTKIIKPTKNDIELLKEWSSVWPSVRDSVMPSVWSSVMSSVWSSVMDSVWSSVMDSVWDSVMPSVWDSVWPSVWSSVMDSVWPSVRDSVWDSVWPSVWSYFSTFFDIDYKYDYSPCIKLWERGLVPSFDGTTWRLHSGKKATIVYEWRKK